MTLHDQPLQPPSGSLPLVYQTAFALMDQGFCLMEKVNTDIQQLPDFRYLLVNPAFHKHTGLQDVVGKTIREVVPEAEQSILAIYDQVAATGESRQFEAYVASLDLWLEANVFRISPELAQLAVLFTNINGRKQAEDMAATELRDTQLLQALSAQLVSVEATQPMYDQILTAAMALTRADAGTLQLYDAATQELVLLTTRGFGPGMTHYFHRVNADSQTACGIALKTNQRTFADFHTNDTDESLRMHVEAGYLSAQSTPLITRLGTPIGMLNTHWRASKHRPTDRELRFLDLLARQAADLIEQRRAERVIRESEAKYRSLFNSIDEGFCLFDLQFDAEGNAVDWIYREANPAFEGQTGYLNAVGKSISDLQPDLERSWFERFAQVARTGEPVRFVQHTKAIDRWYDVYAFDVGGAGENRVALLFTDISERKRTEEALRAAQDRLQLILRATHTGTFVYHIPTDRGEPDARMLALFGLPSDGTLNLAQALTQLIHPDDRRSYAQAVAQATDPAGDGLLQSDIRVGQPDGSHRWISITAQTMFAPESRQPTLMYGVASDITERKQRQAQQDYLLRLSDHLRGLVDPMAIQQAAMQLLGQHLQVSRAFYGDMQADQDTLLIGPGYARDTFPLEVQVRFSEFDADLTAYYGRGQIAVIDDVDDSPLVNERSKAEFALIDCRAAVGVPLLKEGKVRGILSLHQTVPRHWTATEISLAHETAERTWAAVERARAEEALRESQRRFESIANLVPDLLWDSQPDGATNWYNQRWLDYTGQRFEEAIGLGWTEAIHPDEREASARHYGQAVAAGTSLRQEHRIRRYDGAYRWFIVGASPLRDQSGQVVNMYGAATDIHEAKRLEMNLLEADRRKDEFLAMLAHELRNPMSTISSGLQILTLTTGGDDRSTGATVASILDMMNRQTDHLVRMVDDLLDVSRISRGKIELKTERVNLVELVSQAAESARSHYEEQGTQLHVELPQAPIYLAGDATRLTQVVANLLTNGARYTGEQGQVWLSLAHQDGEAILRVRDNGVGLGTDQLEAIFELFVQVDNSAARSKGGLGLGLTLVKRLVELHGGHVEAHSEGQGQGSTFTVQLPTLVTATDPVAQAVQPVAAQSAPKRLLVIDDNADAGFTLAMLLKLKGYEVHTQTSGRAGLTAAEQLRPSAILLDIGMPELDGYATCELIRQQPWGGAMVVIALTGYGQAEDRQRTQAAGFDGHLVKPVDLGALTNLLTDLLDKEKG